MEKQKLVLQDGTELPYRYEQGVFHFEQDIQIGEWAVRKEIARLRDREPSPYMYDWTDHLDFKVIDRHDIERTIVFYYNGGPPQDSHYNELIGICYGSPERAIKHFLENYKPFYLYKDWEGFPANYIMTRIKGVLDNDKTAEDKLREIKRIVIYAKNY